VLIYVEEPELSPVRQERLRDQVRSGVPFTPLENRKKKYVEESLFRMLLFLL